MIYLLDTNVCIKLLNATSKPIVERMCNMPRHEIALCQIVKAELYYGAYNSQRRDANLEVLSVFFNELITLPFDDLAAECYGRLRAELKKNGTPIGPNDLQIAAVAVHHEATLITHNIREFSKIPGLFIEDWETTAEE